LQVEYRGVFKIMQVQLTNTALQYYNLDDIGDVRTPKLTREGKRLELNVVETLPDDAATLESRNNGALAKAIADGDVTVIAETTATTQSLSHWETAAGAQTIVTLAAGYTTGNNSLHVYVDGALQPKPASGGATYAETDATTFTFLAPLGGGEDIQAIWTK
jgi:hypothetical protein